MQEYRRLGNIGLFQRFISPFKHRITDPETENRISLFKKFFCNRIGFIQVLSHSAEL